MGLDMYAYATNETPDSAVDFDVGSFGDLHGWMEQLYRDKGGSADSFNCVNVALTQDDLERLEADIKANALPETVGFLFGDTDGSETQDDLAFVTKAREAIQAGACVFYTSWW